MYALLLINITIPFVMILVGSILKKHPVADMDSHNGYNTPVSRKSQAHWDYAQKIAPDIFISTGTHLAIIEIVLSVLFFTLQFSPIVGITIGNIIGFAFLIWSFYKTDSKIKKDIPA